jgi:membrane protease YdiL (CAAX protease family)
MSGPSQGVRRRADLAAVVFALVFPGLFTWVYFVALRRAPAGLQQTVYAAGKTIQFVFPVFWVLAIQRRPPARSRLSPARSRLSPAGLAEGLLFGLAAFALGFALYQAWLKPAGLFQAAGEQIQAKIVNFGIHGPGAYLVLAAFYSLIHSFLEEYYWRWFVFGQLRSLMPWQAAVGVSSAGFMAHHVILLATFFGWSSPAAYLFSLGVAVGGAYWAWLYHRTRSLYGPWLSPLLIDAAVFAIGYDLVQPLFR